VGRLKVSFFGPFYGGYNVIALDDDYHWSLVAGPSQDYLWILARSPELPDDIVAGLVARARALDFPTEEFIFVSHEPREAPARLCSEMKLQTALPEVFAIAPVELVLGDTHVVD
jgi:hypothetical protein